MAQEVLISVSLIILIVAVTAIISRIIKQPPIIAYLVSGIIVGPLLLNLIGPSSSSAELMQVFAHIGVAFLLFIVGLSLDFRLLKEVGKVSAIAGLAQIIVTGGIGFYISTVLGFSTIASIYIALALAFSSTVVVVKILSDKKEVDTLHGRIALGILIIQDLFAAVALMAIPLLQKQGNAGSIINNLGIIIILIAVTFLLSSFVFKKLLDYLARNQEVLFLFGIAWALTLSAAFDYLGFSSEIGALIAGMSLASSKYTLELGGKIKPLRDFFIVLFFVFFGSQLAVPINITLIKNAILLSIFVIIGKPIIVMAILRIFGYKKKTNFLTGSSLAQISEFSLILALLGFNLGQLSQEVMSLIVLIAIITIGISSYGIYYGHFIFNKISNLLFIFEGKKHRISEKQKEESYEIILIGYHRIGYQILKTLKKLKKSFVVIDYNPKVILSLGKEKVNCIYGDAGDKDFLSQINLSKTKIIISSVPDTSSNLNIRDRLKNINSKATFIATAEQPRAAMDLYGAGIDYVIIPHHLGGKFISTIIEAFGANKEKYKEAGKDHYKELKAAKNNSNYM